MPPQRLRNTAQPCMHDDFRHIQCTLTNPLPANVGLNSDEEQCLENPVNCHLMMTGKILRLLWQWKKQSLLSGQLGK